MPTILKNMTKNVIICNYIYKKVNGLNLLSKFWYKLRIDKFGEYIYLTQLHKSKICFGTKDNA